MGLEDKLVRKKLEILLKDPALIESYLRMHGPKLDMRKIEALKESRVQAAPAALLGAKDDPVFQIRVKCPVCGQADLLAQELKSKTLSMTFDRFMTPRYQPMKGFRPLNYSLASVTVCPQCLFASPDKKDFITHSVETKSENKSQLGPHALEELKNKTEERKLLLPGIPDFAQFFAHPRSVNAAVLSYKLAVQRAVVEQSFSIVLSWYKAGMYCLKIALLQRDAGQSDDEPVRAAAKHLKASFSRNEAPTPDLECQLLYIIVALHIRLGDFNEAQSYFNVLDKMKRPPPDGGTDGKGGIPASLERWLDMARDLLADRENPGIWKH
jgi:uncharacterized protein (DUF2225 family)